MTIRKSQRKRRNIKRQFIQKVIVVQNQKKSQRAKRRKTKRKSEKIDQKKRTQE